MTIFDGKMHRRLINPGMLVNITKRFLCNSEQNNRNLSIQLPRQINLLIMNANPRPLGKTGTLLLNRPPKSEVVNNRRMELPRNIMNIRGQFNNLASDRVQCGFKRFS